MNYIIFLTVFLIFVLIFFIGSFIASFFIFRKIFTRSPVREVLNDPTYKDYLSGMEDCAKYFMKLNPQCVSITSCDNLILRGYYYDSKNSPATVILVHGYHGEGLYDCSMMFHYYKEKGYSILLPDLRAHGKSEGKYLTFGIMESEDILMWAKFVAEKHKGKPVFLHGISMGGTTVGMTANLDLPLEVKGIINDCGFTSPDEIISYTRKKLHCPFFPFQLYLRFFAFSIAGISLKEKNTVICYASSHIPQLFIHGKCDKTVPFTMSVQNYLSSSSPNKKLILVDGAQHALSVLQAPQKVKSEITRFISSALCTKDNSQVVRFDSATESNCIYGNSCNPDRSLKKTNLKIQSVKH